GSTDQCRDVPEETREARVDGGPQHPDRHSLGDIRRRGVGAALREAPSPTSFFRRTHLRRPRCCIKRTPSPSFSVLLAIRSVAAALLASHDLAATPLASP